METPSLVAPLGAKGIGEGNTMSVPVCIANAVADAIGVENVTLPLTPSRISELIHGEEPPPPERAKASPAGKGNAIAGAGELFLQASPQQIWDTLIDPVKLAAVIPGCHALERVSDNDYHAEVSLGVGPVKGRFQARIKLSDMAPPNSTTLSGGLDGPLGSSRGSGRVRLKRSGEGTQVSYDYTAEITGKVAAVGGRMLEGASRVVVDLFFERLVRQVEGLDATMGPPAHGATSLWRRLKRWLGTAR
jgi:2-furoyl-CoA dehydrogenase large subunit